MKQTIFFLIATISTVLFAEPVRSMLGSDGSSMVQTDGHDLPDGIVAVKYIESTRNSHIATTIECENSDLIQLDADIINTGEVGQFIIMCNGNINSFFFRTGSSQQAFNIRFFASSGDIFVYAVGLYSHHIYELAEGGFFVDGIKKGELSSTILANGYYHIGWEGRSQKVKFYSIKIYEQEGEVRSDLIPVRFLNENDEWEGAMYDLVSGDLFVNDGSGSFLIGPDVEE